MCKDCLRHGKNAGHSTDAGGHHSTDAGGNHSTRPRAELEARREGTLHGASSGQFETVALAKAQKRAARQLKELPPDLSVKQAVAEWNRRAAAPYIAAQARDKLREINEMIQAGKEEAGGVPVEADLATTGAAVGDTFPPDAHSEAVH